MLSEARSIEFLFSNLAQKCKTVCWLNKPHLWPLGCPTCFYLYYYFFPCLCTLSPSFFGTLKAPSSDRYPLYQEWKTGFLKCPKHPHICTCFVYSNFPFPFLQTLLCFQKPFLDRQMTAVLVMPRVLYLHLWQCVWLMIWPCQYTAFLRMLASFLIHSYISSRAYHCALDKADFKKDGTRRTGNNICLHRTNCISRQASSGLNATPRLKERTCISHGDGKQVGQPRKSVWIRDQQPLTNISAVVLGEKKAGYSAIFFGLKGKRWWKRWCIGVSIVLKFLRHTVPFPKNCVPKAKSSVAPETETVDGPS